MVDLSEAKTREEIIDPILKDELGWKEDYIQREVNSVKSKFASHKYEFFSGSVEKGVDRFIDYVLTDEYQNPIAIIEAKKFSVDPDKGEIQATTYQKDVEDQIKIAIPIFLTNGKKWYFKEKGYPMREVSGPFSQEDLVRKVHSIKNRKDLSNVEVNEKITDRSKSIQIVKQILNHFNLGNRKALINMATGTGKTRVAMAIIDALVKTKRVERVLFVVDRISLGNQAYGHGFQKFFHSTPQCLLNEQGFDDNKRFYVSTVQTLMAKQKSGGSYFQKFSPGFFDLIIFDEAHRSYYDRNNLVMKYFDSLILGLTATPSKTEERNTYDLFDCERGNPTVSYTYDEAVQDNVLAPYDSQIIETKVMGFGIKGLELDAELKTNLIKQEEDPEKFEVPGTKFAKYFKDEKTNDLIIQEFMNRCYKTQDGKPCKTIFFCISVDHAKELKKRFGKLYPNLADDVVRITSEQARYMDEVKRFEKDSSPRIALSVGVLDTGVDIPEICNLVFVRPVFSHIRFWQMVGRGTRHISACNHKDWLPEYDGIHDKKDFRILDFKFGEFSNVKEHQLESTDNKKTGTDIRIKIFEKELELLKKKLTDKEKKIIEEHVVEKVNKIDQKSFIVRDKVPIIKKVVSEKYNLEEHIKDLEDEIAPLLQFSEFGNGKVQTFISNCTDLFLYVKEGNKEGIDKIQDIAKEKLENIWSSNLEAVRSKSDEIMQVLQEKFWEELTFEDVDFLIREIAPLMVYYEKFRKARIHIDAPDFVKSVEDLKMEVKENPDLKKFKESELIQKIKKDGVTWKELVEISKQLSELNPAWSIENVQKTQDFVVFLRDILELKDLPDPEEMIKREFENLIKKENKNYNADQISFLRLLGSYFAHNKHLEKQDFTAHPLSEENPLQKFNTDQLVHIISEVEKIKIK